MNKRKIMLLAVSLCMVAILGFGSTLAYLTDEDHQVNTFTTGNVAIDLFEDFGDNDETTLEKLLPVTYDATGKRVDDNVIEKEVFVENTGSEPAFVRVHIAIPSILDNGDPSFDASANVLHFNFDSASTGEGKWDWSDATGSPYTGEWNYYETSIGGEDYNVYVVTYETALEKGDVTVAAMTQVYLDAKVSNSDITTIKDELGEKWYIYVAAEGCQAQGFDDAHYALNTSFGDPTDTEYTSKIDWDAVSKGKAWVDND